MTTLFNSGAGAVAETSDLGVDAASTYVANQVPAAPAAPALTGKRVNVVAPDGRAWSVDEAELPSVAAQGWKKETAEAKAIREYVQENKGLSGTAEVALRSFLNEATFGVSDAAIDSTADSLEIKKAEALKRDHAAANILGGVAGFGTSLLYGGEFFDAARAAGKGAEALVLGGRAVESAAGHAATSAAYRTAEHALAERAAGALVTERLVQAGVPAAEAAIAGPSIARKMAASAAGMATEGAIFSAPKALTEAALGDPERAGETLLYGLGGGALIGAAGPAAKGVWKAATSGIGRVKLPGSYRELAGQFAEEQAFKSLASNQASLKKAAREATSIEGGQRGIGRELLDSGLVRGVKEDVETYAERLAAAKQEAGEKVGSMYAKLDELGAETGLSKSDLGKKMRTEVLDPLLNKPGFESVAAKVEAYVNSFELKAETFNPAGSVDTVTFERLHEVRVALDDLVYRSGGVNPAEHIKELRSIRRMIQEDLVEKGEALAQKHGQEFARPLKEANLRYARLSAAESAAADFAELRKLTNRSLSPTDYGVGGIGALASPLSALGGIAAAVGHKFVREEGNALAAKALDRYARGAGLAGILEANHAAAVQLERVPALLSSLAGGAKSSATTTLPTHAISSIAGGLADRKARSGSKDDVYAHFAELAERLTDLSSNPTRMQAELTRIMEPFEADAPGVTSALAQKAPAAVQHLLETMPRGMNMPATGLTPARASRPTAAQIAEWGRRWQVVQDPFIVLDRIADRSLTRPDVETLEAVFPRLRAEIGRRAQMWAAEGGGKTIPASARQKVGLALGINLDPTNIAAFQRAHAERLEATGNGGGGGPSRGAPKLPSMQTDVGRLSMK